MLKVKSEHNKKEIEFEDRTNQNDEKKIFLKAYSKIVMVFFDYRCKIKE